MAREKDPIVQHGTKNDTVLHKVADAVSVSEIRTKKIQDILALMSAVLAKEEDGVAIAAPQIGIPLRIFVVKAEALENTAGKKDLVFINPVITKRSRTLDWMDEGCLSVRNWFGKVKRSEKATVRAFNEQGKFFERGGSGLLAQIFQHEVDHLNGTLFTERAVELIEFKPEKKKRAVSASKPA
jgi:peptide deformylase